MLRPIAIIVCKRLTIVKAGQLATFDVNCKHMEPKVRGVHHLFFMDCYPFASCRLLPTSALCPFSCSTDNPSCMPLTRGRLSKLYKSAVCLSLAHYSSLSYPIPYSSRKASYYLRGPQPKLHPPITRRHTLPLRPKTNLELGEKLRVRSKQGGFSLG